MCDKIEQKQQELKLTIEEPVYTHVHQSLQQQTVTQYSNETEQRLNRSDLRKQLYRNAEQEVVVAPEQPVEPVAAPAPESYKEKRTRVRQEKATVKEAMQEGKRYSPNANLQTASLMQARLRAQTEHPDTDSDVDSLPEEELTEKITGILEIKVTADQFTEENFPAQSPSLQKTCKDYRSLQRLQETKPAYFEQLRTQNSLRYHQICNCANLAAPLADMIRVASIACGVTAEGAPVQEKNIVEHARSIRAEMLRDFAGTLESFATAHVSARDSYLEQQIATERDRQIEAREQFQEAYTEENAETSWIKIPSFHAETLYASTQAVRMAIEKNSTVYRANQTMVDKAMDGMLNSMDVYAQLDLQVQTLTVVQQTDYPQQTEEDKEVLRQRVTERLREVAEKSEKLRQEYRAIQGTLEKLLTGGALGTADVMRLIPFGYELSPEVREKVVTEASATGVRMEWQKKVLADAAAGAGFAGEELSKLDRSRTLLRENDLDFNIHALQTLHQVRILGIEAPTKALYNELRKLLQPRVEAMLAVDMKALETMDDDQLMAAEPMLDALCGDAMHVADLLKTYVWRHATNTKGNRYTMRDELLGDRVDDYASRGMLLRSYHEKARALAMYRASVLNVLPESAYKDAEKKKFDVEMRDKTETQRKEEKAAWLQENCIRRIEIGDRGIAVEHGKTADLRDPTSAAFIKKGMQQRELQAESLHYSNGKFSELFQKIHGRKNELSEEVLTPQQLSRLQGTQYRLAGMTRKEATEKGIASSIKEPIFRSFYPFLELPATETMSEAEVLQMFSDMAADSQIEIEEDSKDEISPEQMEELTAARRINMRGCRQFKENMRLQYDYLSRKYGTSIEKMNVVELTEHYQELIRDLANGQVDTSMMLRIPGLFDPNNPEDELLRAQVEYYNQMGFLPSGTIGMIGSGTDCEESLTSAQQIVAEGVAENKAYLLAHSQPDAFGEELRQGVTVGERRRPID